MSRGHCAQGSLAAALTGWHLLRDQLRGMGTGGCKGDCQVCRLQQLGAVQPFTEMGKVEGGTRLFSAVLLSWKVDLGVTGRVRCVGPVGLPSAGTRCLSLEGESRWA